MKRHGFTLVELLVVIAIIGLLSGILIPVVRRGVESARLSKCVQNARQLGIAMEQYCIECKAYPDASLGGAEKVAAIATCKKLGVEPQQVACPVQGDPTEDGDLLIPPLRREQFGGFRGDPGGPPAEDVNAAVGYVSWRQGSKIPMVAAMPGSTPLLVEGDSANHAGKFVVCFLDGHVEDLEDVDSEGGTRETGTCDRKNSRKFDLGVCGQD